ncbi:MAG TPA: LamG-like jellyroll fold domain-containing protein [Candidatus Acidoferrales bacterium]|nr:LamG-like jellyroll fold domain-containing protein [Candidatus Acidoferrales bacterium]
MRQAKAQSAMEYLMTYGWAILVIAVVLAVMFSLGLFNANTYGGRAHAGSCTIQRPYGPNTTQLISLAGVCNGQMPQFVAMFNGQNAYVSFGNPVTLSSESGPGIGSSESMSLCMWYDPISTAGYNGIAMKSVQPPSSGNEWEYFVDSRTSQGYSVNSHIYNYSVAGYNTGSLPKANTWYFTCFTFDAQPSVATSYYYLNGRQFNGAFSESLYTTYNVGGTGNFVIGVGPGGYSNVEISNVQVYSSEISANDVNALYLEGIGGAPVNLQSLVGWWPLNGDAVDYSGNGNNGAMANVILNSQWTNGYTQP